MIEPTKSAAVLLAGPTASGKSALAMRLAEALGGVVINADALQVYRELRILTARPSVEDERRIPHRLYGHVSANEAYSVGRYLSDVAAVLRTVSEDGLRPIIVGGTGLYFKALLEGLSPIPAVPDAVRTHWRSEACRLGAAGLHALLQSRDPAVAGRLAPTDTQRLTRALEVLDATGRSLDDWQSLKGTPLLNPTACVGLVLAPPRALVYARCDRRFDAMMTGGALEEVQALMDAGLDPTLPALGALGVAPLAAFLRGETSQEAAIECAKRDTRRYVKRQMTWLKRNMMSWIDVNLEEMERNSSQIRHFIDTAPHLA